MAKQGWIALDRSIMDSWLWKEKPFNKASAWIDLLLLANHDDNKFLLGNELIEVKRGSFVTSEKKLMERWGWGNTKVRNFLNLLKSDGMITQETTAKRSVIHIVNYKVYQDKQSANKVSAKRSQSANKVSANTNNNDNNENNDNKLSYSDIPKLNDVLVKFVEHRKKLKKPMTDYAVKLLIGKLNKMTPDIDKQIAILKQSIESGWLGVFELKEEKASGATYNLDTFEKMLNEKDMPKKKNGFDNFMDELASLRE